MALYICFYQSPLSILRLPNPRNAHMLLNKRYDGFSTNDPRRQC